MRRLALVVRTQVVQVDEPILILTFVPTFNQFLANFEGPVLGSIEADVCKLIVTQSSFESSCRDLNDLHSFAALRIQKFS